MKKSNFIINNEIFEYEISNIELNSFIIKSSPYDYIVNFVSKENIIDTLDSFKKMNSEKHFIFIDENVYCNYKNSLFSNENRLEFNALEKNKTIDFSLKLILKLTELNFNKNNKLISVGGGITQDVSALTRALYKRGVDWIYYPTTLLAMSDSCIGAKSAINFKENKNLLGLFSAPKEIFIYTGFLSTLNTRDILSGYGEITKLSIIGGEDSMSYCKSIMSSQSNLLENIDLLIKLALVIKKVVIEKDEFDINSRKALNYGHTIAHALEPLANYKIPHGIAVLIGMIIENYIARDFGILNSSDCNKINDLLMPLIDVESKRILKNIKMDNLFINMKKDKKNEKNAIAFAIPKKIGHFQILHIDQNSELKTSIIKALNKIHEEN